MNAGWISNTPKWFQAGAVILGLLGIGAAGGKAVNDFIGYRELIIQIKLLRTDVQQQTCIQVAQLRHGDWTLCVVPNSGTNKSAN